MGWSFNYVDRGRDAHIAELTSQSHFSPDYEPLAHRVVGNNVWQLVLHKPTGRKFICLDLIAKERNGGWGYKGMSEDMGPYQVNCPLSLLNQASPVEEGGYAHEWRQKVRAYHAAKASKAKPAPGLLVTYCGHQYRLDAPMAPRKGWRVTRTSDGCVFRLKAAQLNQALLAQARVNQND